MSTSKLPRFRFTQADIGHRYPDGLPPVYACTMVGVYRVQADEPRACECPKCGAPIALGREPVMCSYCRWVVRP